MSGIFAIPLFEGTFFQNLARLMFAYFLGLWLFRNRDRLKFIPALSFPCLGIVCALLFSLPNLPVAPEVNFLILAIGFPVIIMSASREVMSGAWAKAGALLGEISYPLYLTHLPVIWTEGAMLKHVFPHVSPILFGFVTVPTAIAFAYVSLKIYDEPVRAFCKRMLTKKALCKSGREVVKCAESIR
jgi:peptidoglycan/LPS O-acetylase OafA/YrhL